MKIQEFIHRKVDHLRYALEEASQAKSRAEWDCITLIHDSLPDLNLDQVSILSDLRSSSIQTPYFIAGMTAGHPNADQINDLLARKCAQRGWVFGLGSQRRELDSEFEDHPSHALKERYPTLRMVSNLGISQLIEVQNKNHWNRLQEVLTHTGSEFIAIHLNPIQEVIQEEGTPRFKGGVHALEELKKKIALPLILKETGSGMSRAFLKRVKHLEPFALDVSGLGGTHWGRVEGLRAQAESVSSRLGETFQDWGVGTLSSVLNAKEVFAGSPTEVWASGGVRNGLDAAKCLAMGAKRVGFAKPALESALKGEECLEAWMMTKEAELRTALFCTNTANLSELDETKIEGNKGAKRT